jgi:hypothetical protein
MAIFLHAAPALALGSASDSVGSLDKSLSGSQYGDTLAAPREELKPRERLARDERPSRGGVGRFDGFWNSASFGRTCPETTTDLVTISGGEMSGTGFSGRVSGSGSVSGVWAGSGLSAIVNGRISGNRGSGSFRRSDGCVGTWTLDRRD